MSSKIFKGGGLLISNLKERVQSLLPILLEDKIVELWNDVAQGTAVGGRVAEGHAAVHAPGRLLPQSPAHVFEVVDLLPVCHPPLGGPVGAGLPPVLDEAPPFVQQLLLLPLRHLHVLHAGLNVLHTITVLLFLVVLIHFPLGILVAEESNIVNSFGVAPNVTMLVVYH